MYGLYIYIYLNVLYDGKYYVIRRVDVMDGKILRYKEIYGEKIWRNILYVLFLT